MEQENEELNTSIINEGDSQNEMENVEAGRDIEQKNEIHQHHRENSNVTVIPDPNAQNFWIDVCETVANLPISETKILGTLVGSGSLGILAMLAISSPWNGMSVNPFHFDLLFGLGFVSSLFIGFVVGYVNTDTDSRCPECDKRFAVRPIEVRKTDTTERENGPNIIHGEVDRECRNCDFEETLPETWTPDEFVNL